MAAPTQQEVTQIVEVTDRLTKDVGYSDSIKMDVQQIEGTRYKFRFSESSNG